MNQDEMKQTLRSLQTARANADSLGFEAKLLADYLDKARFTWGYPIKHEEAKEIAGEALAIVARVRGLKDTIKARLEAEETK